MDFEVRKCKKLTKVQARQMYDLFTANISVICEETILTFYLNGEFVGATLIRYDAFDLYKGKKPGIEPGFEVYINYFEVVKDRRGEGIGEAMFRWLEDNLNVFKFTLCHRDFSIDKKASYRFWRKMGFRKPNILFSEMEKVYK